MSTKTIMKTIIGTALGLSSLVLSTSVWSRTYELPTNGNVIGQVSYETAQNYESLEDIAKRYDLGLQEMMNANPGVKKYWAPTPGMKITIPARHILPAGPRTGLVLSLAELRLYFYHPDGRHVSTYPIGIGKEGWLTPTGTTKIVRKRENPTWTIPDSILAEKPPGHPTSIPPGPDNPLGKYAMNLGIPGYLIHSTIYPRGVGMRSSHGCIRMLPAHIEKLFHQVSEGTVVRLTHEPYKIGRVGNDLFLQTVPALGEKTYQSQSKMEQLIKAVVNTVGEKKYWLNFDKMELVTKEARGMPEAVGHLIP